MLYGFVQLHKLCVNSVCMLCKQALAYSQPCQRCSMIGITHSTSRSYHQVNKFRNTARNDVLLQALRRPSSSQMAATTQAPTPKLEHTSEFAGLTKLQLEQEVQDLRAIVDMKPSCTEVADKKADKKAIQSIRESQSFDYPNGPAHPANL